MIQSDSTTREKARLVFVRNWCETSHPVMICGGNAGERRSLTIFAQGTPFPLRKAKDVERLNVVQDETTRDRVIPDLPRFELTYIDIYS